MSNTEATNHWIPVQRDDGETVGFIEPLDEQFQQVVPRNMLGQALSDPCALIEGEELLIERGLAELIKPWVLDASLQTNPEKLTIIELSPQGIVLANERLTKAMAPTPRIHVPWPDTEHRLTPYRSR